MRQVYSIIRGCSLAAVDRDFIDFQASNDEMLQWKRIGLGLQLFDFAGRSSK